MIGGKLYCVYCFVQSCCYLDTTENNLRQNELSKGYNTYDNITII